MKKEMIEFNIEECLGNSFHGIKHSTKNNKLPKIKKTNKAAITTAILLTLGNSLPSQVSALTNEPPKPSVKQTQPVPAIKAPEIPQKPMTEITKEIANRLYSYPYYEKTKYKREPVYSFTQLQKDRPTLPKKLLEGMYTVIKLEPNEKLYTNESFCYVTYDWNYVVRGVLQTKLGDGTVTEQDIEIQFWYGKFSGQTESKYYFKEIRELGKKNIINTQIFKDAQTKDLTQDIVKRLQSYPYNDQVKFNRNPKYGFDKILKERPDLPPLMIKNMLSVLKFDPNEKFLTNESLCYVTWDWGYVIRGVLQTTLPDGTITEQDTEFHIIYGKYAGDTESKTYFKEEREFGPKVIIKKTQTK